MIITIGNLIGNNRNSTPNKTIRFECKGGTTFKASYSKVSKWILPTGTEVSTQSLSVSYPDDYTILLVVLEFNGMYNSNDTGDGLSMSLSNLSSLSNSLISVDTDLRGEISSVARIENTINLEGNENVTGDLAKAGKPTQMFFVPETNVQGEYTPHFDVSSIGLRDTFMSKSETIATMQKIIDNTNTALINRTLSLCGNSEFRTEQSAKVQILEGRGWSITFAGGFRVESGLLTVKGGGMILTKDNKTITTATA